MAETLAFLSYTRKDDAFFGGYITEFSKMLENAVHVVTGDRSFRVFQDIEGLIVGEKWEKKLAEVIHDSSFFVPMLSPLFFNSDPCRKEAEEFLEHERTLGRDDLVLPIYFLTSAKLEKEEEKVKDALATEVASRQIFDWRRQAHVPLREPAAREAMLKLAGAVETAMSRLGAVREPTGHDGKRIADDPELTAGVADVRREELDPRTILWVDDNPSNNVWERKALESYGVRFVLAQDTAEAERLLRERGPFAAIISDLGRVSDAQAGFTLLSHVRQAKNHVPYFIYTTGRATALEPLAKLRGAQGLTANPDALVELVLRAIR